MALLIFLYHKNIQFAPQEKYYRALIRAVPCPRYFRIRLLVALPRPFLVFSLFPPLWIGASCVVCLPNKRNPTLVLARPKYRTGIQYHTCVRSPICYGLRGAQLGENSFFVNRTWGVIYL